MASLDYYLVTFRLLHQVVILGNTVFNRELWYTKFWYQSCGYYAKNWQKHIFTNTASFPTPFHWGYFSYFVPTRNIFSCFDLVFLFIFVSINLSCTNYVTILIVLSPLFGIYYLGEVKTEKYFFAVLWTSFCIDFAPVQMLLNFLSMLHITTFVTNWPFLFSFDYSIASIVFSAVSLSAILYTILRRISWHSVTEIFYNLGNQSKKNRKNTNSRPAFFKVANLSKAQLVSIFMVFALYLETSSFVFIGCAITLLSNNVLLRFMDASTERRILLTCVFFFAQLQPIIESPWVLFVFFPFHWISHIPEHNFNSYEHKNHLAEIDLVRGLLQRIPNGSTLLVEFTGKYTVSNHARYLWYVYEYLLLGKSEVFPSIFTDTSYPELYQKYEAAFSNIAANEDFISKFSHVVLYTDRSVESFYNAGYSVVAKVNTPNFGIFGVQQIVVMEAKS